MIPTTLLGLLLFVVLLAPGFIYELRLGRTRVVGPESPLREVLRIIVASLLCGGVALAVAAVIRARRPQRTPDVGELVRRPGTYLEQHYQQAASWGLALLGLACVIGFVVADPRLRRAGRRAAQRKPLRWLLGSRAQDIDVNSAWYRILHRHEDDNPEPIIYIGCQLDDGSYISGQLSSLSADPAETADRDVLLSAPLIRMDAEGTETGLHAAYTAISARRIIRMDAWYLEPGTPLPEPSSSPAVEDSASREESPSHDSAENPALERGESSPSIRGRA